MILAASHRHGSRGRALALCLLLLVAPALLAETSYLPPGHPDGVALLAPPPAAGSAEEAADDQPMVGALLRLHEAPELIEV